MGPRRYEGVPRYESPRVCTFVIKVVNAVILIFRCATIKGITEAKRSPLLQKYRGMRGSQVCKVPRYERFPGMRGSQV